MPVLNVLPVQSFATDNQGLCVPGEIGVGKLLSQQTQMTGSKLYETEITALTERISKSFNAGLSRMSETFFL